ncbi:GNAT family N-acetyltransferase [Dyadobacter flavalbus]|uniref:GNAT family N-acetyltransferase n=1 Tax=Dyadobacter flavalbus TaxID=2579942 RepID=A0A5M8QNW4_9BACT|nr:GNAT family N-acetyltransferase [Dyadobacter flavalbus]KAA6436968.1 GNAT family N-acetyltransferase [Dyadobacter flavalbus]
MPSFAIKHASVDDIPDIIRIQEKTWETTYKDILSKEQIDYMFEKIYSHDSLNHQMLNDKHQFLMLENNGNPEGFASVSKESPETFKLHKIYVLPSLQGSGAGKYMLNEIENYIRSEGGNKLILNVNRFNKARAFYEKMGFYVTEEKDIPFGPYWMNDYILEKDLR